MLTNSFKTSRLTDDNLYIFIIAMKNKSEEINAMNLKVLQQDQALKKTERIIKTVRFGVLARYDEDSKHWNYLKIKGPLFLIVDTFGTYRIVFLNHYS